MVEELTPVAEVHDEVPLVFSLEGEVEIHDERILYLLQYFSLSYNKSLFIYQYTYIYIINYLWSSILDSFV